VASADAGVVLLQPADLNLRLSTPNKLWECLSVGTPVVASDFPEIHRVVMDDPDGPLGAVCDPTDDEAIVAALASIVAADAGQRTGLRGRCLRAAHARWNWEEEASRLVALHRRLDLAPAG
jgi:glycosyltransferase involved in cell wall biosynthesis